jgi:hypothetical protein
MVFAQFFSLALDPIRLVEACGDRSVVRIDGRISQLKQELIAEEECRRRHYSGWQLIKGPSLLRAKPITKVVSLFY